MVLEDREEFCSRELFPEAWDVRKIRSDRILEEMDIREEDFVCVMTRGHKDDLQVPVSYTHLDVYKRQDHYLTG